MKDGNAMNLKDIVVFMSCTQRNKDLQQKDCVLKMKAQNNLHRHACDVCDKFQVWGTGDRWKNTRDKLHTTHDTWYMTMACDTWLCSVPFFGLKFWIFFHIVSTIRTSPVFINGVSFFVCYFLLCNLEVGIKWTVLCEDLMRCWLQRK